MVLSTVGSVMSPPDDKARMPGLDKIEEYSERRAEQGEEGGSANVARCRRVVHHRRDGD
jgi:hypothetical protein